MIGCVRARYTGRSWVLLPSVTPAQVGIRLIPYRIFTGVGNSSCHKPTRIISRSCMRRSAPLMMASCTMIRLLSRSPIAAPTSATTTIMSSLRRIHRSCDAHHVPQHRIHCRCDEPNAPRGFFRKTFAGAKCVRVDGQRWPNGWPLQVSHRSSRGPSDCHATSRSRIWGKLTSNSLTSWLVKFVDTHRLHLARDAVDLDGVENVGSSPPPCMRFSSCVNRSACSGLLTGKLKLKTSVHRSSSTEPAAKICEGSGSWQPQSLP